MTGEGVNLKETGERLRGCHSLVHLYTKLPPSKAWEVISSWVVMTTCVHTAPVLVPSCSCRESEQVPPVYTRSEVRQHCHVASCWIIVDDEVYDVTKFLLQHPGGEDLILEHAGLDASSAFWDKGHSSDAHHLLREYYIGKIKDESTPKT
ncbi:cytochrome b5-like [Pomacea canaliculata]|uniref:cytochrome b5-like n=1 Tax=Pomacea canaliculata TaxID=400727 RepID=UPI000D728F44|nr:cytochrome b5-like [Pomacea canaliculata]